MSEDTFHLQTRTPLWTGGVDGNCDRLHETALLGSLRWWYEAIVRGLGRWACDPTPESPSNPCEFNTREYNAAKREGRSEAECIAEGIRGSVCAVCYLFGCGGWQRLFRLIVLPFPTVPLHFRTTLGNPGENWLGRIFNGEEHDEPKKDGGTRKVYKIDHLTVAFSDSQPLNLRISFRGSNATYARNQIQAILALASEYGGIGARMQHGFGQVEFKSGGLESALQVATDALEKHPMARLFRSGPELDAAKVFNLSRFFSITYVIPVNELSMFSKEEVHYGSRSQRSETRYLPCGFDLRYKGRQGDEGIRGLREWLRREKGWMETTDPNRLKELDEWLGPRSQWGRRSNTRQLSDECRQASRVFFGMPYLVESTYELKVFGFAPEDHPRVSTPQLAVEIINDYVNQLFRKVTSTVILGPEIIAIMKGAAK